MNENAMMKKMGRGMAKSAMAKKAMPAKKMASGGMTMVKKGDKMVPDFAADGKGKMAKGGMTKMGAVKTSSKPDGVIKKGGTKGKMIAMKMGGKTC
jgi:hypothetical protein